ncbi:MAG: class I SAM-dependent methyltransferase [Myxococcota bacterium]
MPDSVEFPPGFFDREDETDDARFYSNPRFVVHIDAETILALTQAYRELLPPSGAVLDLMSSWVSHLSEEVKFARVTGLGMNEAELAKNPQLTDFVTHDLNREPELPFDDSSFDAVVNAVSVQYLTRPVDVFRSCARVLRPGGIHLVALSHRCFPTKAIRAWHILPLQERLDVVRSYFTIAGGYDEPELLDRSPPAADPLWMVLARRGDAAQRPI